MASNAAAPRHGAARAGRPRCTRRPAPGTGSADPTGPPSTYAVATSVRPATRLSGSPLSRGRRSRASLLLRQLTTPSSPRPRDRHRTHPQEALHVRTRSARAHRARRHRRQLVLRPDHPRQARSRPARRHPDRPRDPRLTHVKANAESTDRALEVLRRRVDALGVAEPSIARSGDRRIIVELPGLQDPREAAEVIGQTAPLTFHPVLGVAEPSASPSPVRARVPAPDPARAEPDAVRQRAGRVSTTRTVSPSASARHPDRRGREERRRRDRPAEGSGSGA